ncbi:MAG: tetratricopeptide repeat protein [Acidobacteriota bacterium]
MAAQKQIILLLIVLAMSSVSLAQTLESVRPGDAGEAHFDDLRVRGYEALFSLDYETANRLFKEMARLYPDHPAGPQCLAATLWLQELNRARHRQALLYSTESFNSSEDEADPRLVEQFRYWTRTATRLAEARLRRNSRDVEALYFLGVTDGLRAVFAAAVERRFRAALSDSSRAVNRHREVLKLDPNFHDAELSIGMRDFIVGSLPLPIKMLARIAGVRGSKKRGLETLERVAREGRWARVIARLLLIDLYKREKRWTEAIAASRELATRYPRNYLFQLQAADGLVARAATLRQTKGATASAASADQDEAFRIFESLLQDRTTLSGSGRAVATDLIHFRYGEALLMAGQPQRATEEFRAASRQVGGEPALTAMARLRAAQSMDLSGRRREALAEYRAVLADPKSPRSYDAAKRGLREPYRMTDYSDDR